MEFFTTDQWDSQLWERAENVYHQSFAAHTRKKRAVIQSMFQKQMCFLHIGADHTTGETLAMAISGRTSHPRVLLIDYIGVAPERRSTGIGTSFMNLLKDWALRTGGFTTLLIEAEAGTTAEDEKRHHFWQANGFILTDYVHNYIWVPEPYQAMYCKMTPDPSVPEDGPSLFRSITAFHRKAYRGV
ncbi:GNAT family N-acetyltransferase [Paenibacillus gansuensis]|uniref:GNAT family N-acetyltransferase n=1 Tax=Paenibacillus gansuensis TaxID=306542 RepID=A0ABW5P932_9BACL